LWDVWQLPVGIVDVLVRLALVVPTGLLFAMVFQSYLRIRNSKMLLISVGFGIFFLHALIAIPELFISAYDVLLDENAHLFINLIALVFILFGTVKD